MTREKSEAENMLTMNARSRKTRRRVKKIGLRRAMGTSGGRRSVVREAKGVAANPR